MKTLVDRSVWSLALRRRTNANPSPDEQRLVAELTKLIRYHAVAIVGLIRQEVLSGIRDSAQFSRIQSRLEPFHDEEIEGSDYIEAARLFNLCRSRGVECGAIDILLCAIAVRLQSAILTNDKGLLRCVATLRAEGIAI